MEKSGFDVLETVRVTDLTLNCFVGNVSIFSCVHVFSISV